MTTLSALVVGAKPQFTEEQRKLIDNAFASLEGKRATLKISEYKSQRTNEQNRYMFGVVYEAIAAETGHSPEEVHELMKSKFAPRRYITIGTIETEIPKSTAAMSTKEMTEYIERIIAFAGSELSVTIPPPNYCDS